MMKKAVRIQLPLIDIFGLSELHRQSRVDKFWSIQFYEMTSSSFPVWNDGVRR